MASFLCISNCFKGNEFIKACKEAGNTVYLVASLADKEQAWAREYIDEIFFLTQDEHKKWNRNDLINGLGYLMKSNRIDAVIALDDFDVENAAHLREHFRINGMGETTCHYFRDKLAMRIKAENAGIPVPYFTSLFHNDDINHFADNTPSPWLLKPRGEASTKGIQKIYSKEDLWKAIDELGDKRHTYLLERFQAGAVYHVDSLCFNGEVIFSRASQYLNPPLEVTSNGGVFLSHTIAFDSDDDKKLQSLNDEIIQSFGLRYGVTHTEFIKSDTDGEFYFLETASRVGGAHISDMVEQSSGINLWEEWAKIETAILNNQAYLLPTPQYDYAGILVSLSHQEKADYSHFTAKEIVWTLDKPYHIGLIAKSDQQDKVLDLLRVYAEKVIRDKT